MASGKWRRPRRISKLVGGTLGVVVLAVAVSYVLKLARSEKSTPVPENLPKNINQQLSGYTFTRSEGGRQIFTVHAARTVAFKNGAKTLLEDVSVEVYGRTATRHDLLKTQRCEYEPETGGLSCLGKVEIELNAKGNSLTASGFKGRQPLYLETSKVDYEPRESLVKSDEPIRFRYGAASGSAVGIRYDTKDGWVELTKDVVIDLPPLGSSTSPLRVTSAGLSYEKHSAQAELHGPLEITQGSRRVLAGQGKILLDRENRVTKAILGGGAQGSDFSGGDFLEGKTQTLTAYFDPASNQLRTLLADGDVKAESHRGGNLAAVGGGASLSRLSAQHVDVSFTSGASGSAQPLTANASGSVKLSLESPPTSRSGVGSPGTTATVAAGRTVSERKDLAASEVHFEFYPGGQDLKEAKTIGPGELVMLPADAKEGKRVVTAGQFLMAFGSRNHPERVRGLSHTKVVIEPAGKKPNEVPQESWSDELEAKLDATTQELVSLEQAGSFRFRDGERQAKADRAYYSAQDQVLRLIGGPLLWDPETRIRAEQFRINLRNGMAEGSDRVESTHFGRKGAALLAASTSAPPDAQGRSSPRSADPAFGSAARQEEATTNVLADRVRAERGSQFLHYDGHVRAWNGYDVVESPSLDIYRQQQRIVSESIVVSSHLQPGPTQPGSPSAAGGAMGAQFGGSAPVTVRADRLEYLNEGHKASYRGHVEVETGNTTLKGDSVDVYFSSLPTAPGKRTGGALIERVVASGHVTVTQPARRATGERVEYLAALGKVVMTGGPPALYDEQNGFTTGQSLTFFIRDDSLLVDGGDKSSTLSKRHLAR